MNSSPLPVQTQPVPSEPETNRESFVFLDQRGKRWPRFKRVAFVGALLVFVAAILFVQSLLLPSNLSLPPSVKQLKSQLKALQMQGKGWKPTKPLWLDYARQNQNAHAHKTTASAHHKLRPATPRQADKAVLPTAPTGEKEIHLGFYEGWDPDSLASLKTYADRLTHVCPDWLRLVDGSGTIRVTTDQQVLQEVENHELQLMPLLRNLGEGDSWHAEAVEWLINGTDEQQQAFIAHLVEVLDDMDADGVVID
ncbi:MAG: hypothetical protein AB7E77_07470, partial [Desulfobulbus sp.]